MEYLEYWQNEKPLPLRRTYIYHFLRDAYFNYDKNKYTFLPIA